LKILLQKVVLKKTTQKLLKKFPGLATFGCHNSAMIADRRQFTSKCSLYGMSGSHFYRYNHFRVFPLACTLRTRKVLTQIFGNVQCPILHIQTNSTLLQQCWCGLVSDILKKSRLNWKRKISNTADNAGITQSQARDTRYRPMLELNRLCVSK